LTCGLTRCISTAATHRRILTATRGEPWKFNSCSASPRS
jgi:hypothetical protein